MNDLNIRRKRLDDLVPADYNPRVISDEAMAGLSESIDRFGLVQPIVWNERTGNIVGGHQRHKHLVATGVTETDVVIVDLDESEEVALNVALNNPQIQGEWDTDKIGSVLRSVEEDLPELFGALRLDELRDSLGLDDGEETDTSDDDEPEVQAQVVTELGDLWLLGSHRLLCGDCTDKDNLDRLMAGEQADMGLTSPPYALEKEYEDGVTFDEHLALLTGLANRGLEAVRPGGFLFVNFGELAPQCITEKITGAPRYCMYPISCDYWRIFREHAYELYAMRVWYKPFSRLPQPFFSYKTSKAHQSEWENMWTWRVPGGSKEDVCYNWDRSVHAVWSSHDEEGDKPLTRHVAAFPICIPLWAMQSHSAVGALIWEPFCGSGTTIVAAERTGRKCYATELNPAYTDVAVRRWQNATGGKAQTEGGKTIESTTHG